MNQTSSFLAALTRHREVFAVAEQYAAQSQQLLDAVVACLKAGGKVPIDYYFSTKRPRCKTKTRRNFGSSP